MDQQSGHLRIKFKIEMAHGILLPVTGEVTLGISCRTGNQRGRSSVQAGRVCRNRRGWDWQLMVEEQLMCHTHPMPQFRDVRNQLNATFQQAGPVATPNQGETRIARGPAAVAGSYDVATDCDARFGFEPPGWIRCTAKITDHRDTLR
jgi:hypothetical protein